MSDEKRIFCEVWDHLILSNQCLHIAGKTAKENRTCLNCIFFENLTLKGEIQDKSPKRKAKKRIIGEIKEIEGKEKKVEESPLQEFYTVADVSNILGKPERRVQKLTKEGKIPGLKVGRIWYFRKEEIDTFVSNNSNE